MINTTKSGSISNLSESKISKNESIVSFHSKVPQDMQQAMNNFIEKYPNWDQYRLIQAALAGFLSQNGVENRSITRLYVGNMFGNKSLINKNF